MGEERGGREGKGKEGKENRREEERREERSSKFNSGQEFPEMKEKANSGVNESYIL